MKKIAILGCENSHANNFLKYNIKEGMFADEIEFVGVFSEDESAAQKLNEEFGVPVMKSYDELAGKVDAIMVTARHGKNHYKYAKPYIEKNTVMFIDKPITTSEADAIEFMKVAKENSIKLTGGSSCVHADLVRSLAKKRMDGELGRVLGGYLRAPVNMQNDYGNFWFYSQHLTQVMCEVFGYYPKSVQAFVKLPTVTVVVRYDDFDVTLSFEEAVDGYFVYVNTDDDIVGGRYMLDVVFSREFEEFRGLLNGDEQRQSYSEFIAPVFVIDAINRSLESGKEEPVHAFEEI